MPIYVSFAIVVNAIANFYGLWMYQAVRVVAIISIDRILHICVTITCDDIGVSKAVTISIEVKNGPSFFFIYARITIVVDPIAIFRGIGMYVISRVVTVFIVVCIAFCGLTQ